MSPFFSDRLAWFDGRFCLLLTWALIHFVWQGCLLAATFALLRRSLARSSANVRYAAGVFILLLMAACLPATLWLIDPPPTQRSVAAERVSLAGPALSPAGGPDFAQSAGGAAIDTPPPSAAATTPASAPFAAIVPADEGTGGGQNFWNRALGRSLGRAAAALASVSSYAAAGYALGLGLMLTRVCVGLSIGRRLRRASTPVGDPVTLDLVRRHAARLALRAVPALAWCARVSVPVVVGVLRPMILLPVSLATGLTGRQLEYVLLHELAHIHRYDPLANLLERLIEAMLFFHPAVWWLTRQVSIERENACDDAVLRAGCQGSAYAEALLKVAELCASTSGRAVTPAGLLAATGENPSHLARRIMRLYGADAAPVRPATPTAALLVLSFAFALIALAAWRSPAVAQAAKKVPERLAATVGSTDALLAAPWTSKSWSCGSSRSPTRHSSTWPE